MSWNLLRMSKYVVQSKYLEKLKESNDICSNAFEKANYMIFNKGKPLLSTISEKLSIVWCSFEDASKLSKEFQKNSVLISVDEVEEKKALFAFPLSDEKDADQVESQFKGQFLDMRRAIMILPTEQVQLISRGHTILNWHRNFKFCPSCGGSLVRNVSGSSLACSKPCKPKMENYYPVVKPVAITRVIDQTGQKTLLVRKSVHPKGMYSCVAGFLEPGSTMAYSFDSALESSDTLESSVRREVAEEAGVVVEDIKYFASQTWPIPQNLIMLACTSVAMPDSDKLDLDEVELENGRWFTKQEVKDAIERITKDISLFVHNPKNELIVPPKGAIAFDLLRDWVNK